MDKKELKQMTTKIYEDYGFIKKGRYYYLDLNDVIICSGFCSSYGITYLAFNFSVKAVNSEAERSSDNMFDGYDSMEIQMYFDPDAKGYHKKEICFKSWDREYYEKKLKELLHYYFDPYKEDALNHIRRSYKKIGLVNPGEIILVQSKTKAYLGL